MKKRFFAALALCMGLTLCACACAAQTCSTGHFVMEIPDDYAFMRYMDDIAYWSTSRSFYYIIETDFRDEGILSGEALDGLLQIHQDKDNYQQVVLEDGTIAVLYTEPRDGISSLASCNAYLTYYCDGFCLDISYTGNYDESASDCLSRMRALAQTLRYAVAERTDYELSIQYSKNFQYAVPSGWFHVAQEEADYYYGGSDNSGEGGMYCVQDIPLAENGLPTDLSPEAFYSGFAQSLHDAMDPLTELESCIVTVNGMPVYTGRFMLNMNSGYLYFILALDGENLFNGMYMNASGDLSDPEFNLSIVEALRAQILAL